MQEHSQGRVELKVVNLLREQAQGQTAEAESKKPPRCGALRRFCKRVVEWSYFETTILFLILLNSVFLSMYKPLDPAANGWIETSEWVFQSLFTIEAILKLVNSGIKGYFAEPWNRFDFGLVAVGWVCAPAFPEANLTAFRVVRVLRSLRLLKFIPGIYHLVQIIERSLSQLFSVLLIVLFIIFAFGVIGIELYKDADQTNNPGVPNVIPGFQNIIQSFFTVFQVITREGWEEIMRWITDQPLYEDSIVGYIYFIFLTAVGSLLVLNLIVTVLVLNHGERVTKEDAENSPLDLIHVDEIIARAKERKARNSSDITTEDIHKRLMLSYESGNTNAMTEEKYRELALKYGAQHTPVQVKPVTIATPRTAAKRALLERRISATPAASPSFCHMGFNPPLWLEVCFLIVMLVNLVVVAFGRLNEASGVSQAIDITNIVCGIVYLVEVNMRLLWIGLYKWRHTPRLVLEFTVVYLCFALVLTGVSRVALVFKLLLFLLFTERVTTRNSEDAHNKVLAGSLKHVAPFTMVLVVLLHIFAVAGLHIFGGTFDSDDILGYDTYLRSLLTTFQIVTGEGWNEVMFEAVESTNFVVAIIYYFLLLVVGNFVLLNLILALLIDSFMESVQEDDASVASSANEQLNMLKDKLRQKRNNQSDRSLLHRGWSRQDSFYSLSYSEGTDSQQSEERWLFRYNVLDLLALVTIIIYCIGYYASAKLQLACILLFYAEFVARFLVWLFLDTGDGIDWTLLPDLVFLLLASIHYIHSNKYTLALRPMVAFRLVHWVYSLGVMARTLVRALKPVAVLGIYTILIVSVISLLFVELFAGRFETCIGPEELTMGKTCFGYPGVNCPEVEECLGLNITWRNADKFVHFDNFENAMLVLFETMTLEKWTDGMVLATRVTGYGRLPEEGASDGFALLFVLVVCVCHLFLLQILLAIAIKTYMFTDRKLRGVEVLSSKQRQWVELQIKCVFHRARALRNGGTQSSWRRRLFRFVDSSKFEKTIVAMVLMDSFIMAMQHKDEPLWVTELNVASQIFFGAVYLIEALLKIVAYGRAYFKSFRHLFDFCIVLFVVMGWISLAFQLNLVNLTPLRVLRIAFILPSLKSFLQLIRAAAPALGQVVLILVFFLYYYGMTALDIFSESEYFSTFGNALLSLYILAIGDDWIVLMRDVGELTSTSPVVTQLFFWSFVFIVTYVTINLLIAVMLSTFEQEFVRTSLDQRAFSKFRREWYKSLLRYRKHLYNSVLERLSTSEQRDDVAVEFNVEVGSQRRQQERAAKKIARSLAKWEYLSPEFVTVLLRKLKPPLGLVDFSQGDYSTVDLLALIHISKLPITKSGMVNYNSMLFALSAFRYRVNTREEEIPLAMKKMTLKLHLENESLKKFEGMMEETHEQFLLSHYLAARIIQNAYRKHLGKSSAESELFPNLSRRSSSTSFGSLNDEVLDEIIDEEEFHDCLQRSTTTLGSTDLQIV